MSMNTQSYQRKAQRAEPRRWRHTGSGSEAVMMSECVVILNARRSRKKHYDGQNLVIGGGSVLLSVSGLGVNANGSVSTSRPTEYSGESGSVIARVADADTSVYATERVVYF